MASLPDGKVAVQQQLFAGPEPTTDHPVARPFVLATRGRVEYGVRCPRCGEMHRHIFLGLVRAPCGARYYVQPKRGRTRRAA